MLSGKKDFQRVAGFPSFSGTLIRFSIKRTCQANQVGENSSFIFTVRVRSVPRYHFNLLYVILQMAVKEFFETGF